MVIAILQLREGLRSQHLYLFPVYVALVWMLWAWKVVVSRQYRPYTSECDVSTAVVIPVVDEPVELFSDVLDRVVEQQPDEIVVVINGARNETLERVCARHDAINVVWTETPGKRNAIRLGVEATSAEIVVLVDSDTLWTPDALRELIRPFDDPSVGGVTTRQRILAPERNMLTRWADWLENLRAEYSMPAMSVIGTVGCLPGRTIAFRRVILEKCMEDFMSEKFLGVFLEISDDRTLTNYALKLNYKTVYQSTSLVYTDAPTQWRKLVKQQLRWARGSQYNTLRMGWWMLRNARGLGALFVADIVLPFLLACSALGWAWREIQGIHPDFYGGFLQSYGTAKGASILAVLTVVASGVSVVVRHHRHLRKRPSDIWRIPQFLLISTFLLMPIRIWGFLRMAHVSGWGTRNGAYTGERRRLNPKAALPYLALGVLAGGTVYHG